MTAQVPTESTEQQLLFRWARLMQASFPELRLMYHIPNEAKRSVGMAARLKAEGMKPGVPDLCLPVARHGYSALYIEMKRVKGGVVSEKQREWIDALNRAGNLAIVCKGWEEASEAIMRYIQ